jgi:hypothetical protein
MRFIWKTFGNICDETKEVEMGQVRKSNAYRIFVGENLKEVGHLEGPRNG